MVKLLEERLNSLAKLCERYSVQQLSVFGSAARGDFSNESALDFIVEFYPLEPIEHKNAYFNFLFALEDLFERPVDLVVKGVVKNPYVALSIEASQETVYAAA